MQTSEGDCFLSHRESWPVDLLRAASVEQQRVKEVLIYPNILLAGGVCIDEWFIQHGAGERKPGILNPEEVSQERNVNRSSYWKLNCILDGYCGTRCARSGTYIASGC